MVISPAKAMTMQTMLLTVRVLTGFLFMSVALLLASLAMRAFPALRQSTAKKQPLVPYFAVAFIPAYFL